MIRFIANKQTIPLGDRLPGVRRWRRSVALQNTSSRNACTPASFRTEGATGARDSTGAPYQKWEQLRSHMLRGLLEHAPEEADGFKEEDEAAQAAATARLEQQTNSLNLDNLSDLKKRSEHRIHVKVALRIINDDGHVLLFRSSDSKLHGGVWQLPHMAVNNSFTPEALCEAMLRTWVADVPDEPQMIRSHSFISDCKMGQPVLLIVFEYDIAEAENEGGSRLALIPASQVEAGLESRFVTQEVFDRDFQTMAEVLYMPNAFPSLYRTDLMESVLRNAGSVRMGHAHDQDSKDNPSRALALANKLKYREILCVVAGVAWDQDAGRVLVAERPGKGKNKLQRGYWEWPGGKIDPGETADEAIVREMYEELGIKMDPEYLERSMFFTCPFFNRQLVMCFYVGTKFTGTAFSKEGQRFAWATVDELKDKKYPFMRGDDEFVDVVVRKMQRHSGAVGGGEEAVGEDQEDSEAFLDLFEGVAAGDERLAEAVATTAVRKQTMGRK